MRDVTLAIAGSGGDGVITAGDFIVQAAARKGLNAFMLKSYGPQIRGGESSARIRISDQPIYSQGDFVDFLVVFSWKDFARFIDEIQLRKGAVVLYDEADTTPPEDFPINKDLGVELIAVPFKKMASEEIKVPLTKNMVALGVIAELLHLPLDGIKDAVMKKFGKRKPEAAQVNIEAIDLGKKWVDDNLPDGTQIVLEAEGTGEPKLVMTGDDAVAYGALHAGVKIFSGYPITPASPILEFLSKWLPHFGGAVVQTEDEIAAITYAIGASWAGKQAMTASSGPGIALKLEALGLAAIAEIPLVVVNVQRVGPSTGIPSKSEQADLFQAVGGTPGDVPRVVLAPSDVEDNFQVAVEAFYIAEKYQIPVLILSDQFLGERSETIDPDILFARKRVIARQLARPSDLKDYKRYKITDTGVSPMAVPGMKGGQHVISGLEHHEDGRPTSSGTLHQIMSEKRERKMPLIAEESGFVRIYGDEDAELAILAWGSSKGAVREAIEIAREQGIKVKAIVPQLIYPIPEKKLDAALKGVKRAVVIELSFGAQFYRYLRAYYNGLPKDTFSYARSGANPLLVSEVLEAIKEHAGAMNAPQEA